LNQNSLMAIETLCLLSVYAQAAAMHDIAYLYECTPSCHFLDKCLY
jgi:hypothetical protein